MSENVDENQPMKFNKNAKTISLLHLPAQERENFKFKNIAQHKIAKRFPSGELGGQTSSSYTSTTVLLMVFPKDFNLHHGTSGAKSEDCPCSCAFLLIHLCWNVTVSFYLCFSRRLRRFCGKKLIKKIIF
jgi:hypothetical protein